MAGPLPPSHPWPVRLTHWMLALAVLVLMGSGWRIYNASPLFGFRFPDFMTLGGWLAGALQWHFAAIWLLAGALAIYLVHGLLTGRFTRMMWPVQVGEVRREVVLAARLRLWHGDLSVYNHTQRLAYLIAIGALLLLVASGLVLWKPVQFPILRTLLGDYAVARYVHFTAMTALVGFTIVHVLLVMIVPRTLSAMVGIFSAKTVKEHRDAV